MKGKNDQQFLFFQFDGEKDTKFSFCFKMKSTHLNNYLSNTYNVGLFIVFSKKDFQS